MDRKDEKLTIQARTKAREDLQKTGLREKLVVLPKRVAEKHDYVVLRPFKLNDVTYKKGDRLLVEKEMLPTMLRNGYIK